MLSRPMLNLVTLILASALMPVPAMARDGQVDPWSLPGNARPDFELPAVQLRIALDRALAEHAFLSIEAMRTGIAGGEEFEVAAEVLEANTTDVVDLVEVAYGADAAEAFAEQWRNHIAYLVDYTRAVAEGDDDARDLASTQLQTYVDDFSAFLAEANPGLPPDVVEGLIQEHVQQLEQIGSFAEAGFADAYPAIRETYAHMFMVGDGLATGIVSRFSEQFPGRDTAFSPALDMRMTLDRLLGEHTYLAAIAMRTRLTDAPEFDAAVGALDDNSADLAAQIAKIYGQRAGEAFAALWRSHTSLYLDYVAAVAGDDASAEAQAVDGLREYGSDFSSFLADANPFLDEDGLEALLASHTRHLVAQVSSYLDQDYEAAYTTLRQAYQHTETLAAGLAGAIADQFPRLFPDTATAHPMPGLRLSRIGWLLVWVAVVMAAMLTAWPRARLNPTREVAGGSMPLMGWQRIAVDEAGSGYASLRHIIELRPRYVKLDRGLVTGINADPKVPPVRRDSKSRPPHVASSATSCSLRGTGTGCSGTLGGRMRARGESATSPSSDIQRKKA